MTAPLHGMVDVDVADVHRNGVRVARLVRRPTSVEFAYLPDTPPQLAVATTLPVGGDVVVTPGRAVPPYFAGLLPEGRRLTALRTALKTSADDDFAMLLAVGADPVGDVQVVPAGEPCPPFVTSDETAPSLEQASFAELFATATGVSPDRVGLAGVQDKVSGRMISLPVTLRRTAAILKLDPPEFPHLVENEAFFLGVARDCGVRTTATRVVHDRDGRPGLLVERFDRVADEEGVRGLPVEDGCQASGRYPGDKYALSSEAVATTLADLCRARPVAALDIFRQFVVAIATGNGDLHAKNLSIVRRDGEWTVAPAYDVPSSYPYGDATLAMSIAGSREGQVSRKRLLAFADAIGLRERAASMTIDATIDAVTPWIDRVDRLPFDDRRIHDLRRFMSSRLQLLGR
ncbi:MAG: type II toxin-antitoxin system HipA family toxin [Acidimicrobiia bacterium]